MNLNLITSVNHFFAFPTPAIVEEKQVSTQKSERTTWTCEKVDIRESDHMDIWESGQKESGHVRKWTYENVDI